ncbi:hypothetical protein DXG03_002499 [Asterophora parasitica]|uniref:Uncharacterized protein n=1 Tax=Asterophora parasitica TaxID=117018 RepID=A0A9P7KC79_9AGAR|nr:hypothetical protein DXG03_002499 [Asterophora parasitica]
MGPPRRNHPSISHSKISAPQLQQESPSVPPKQPQPSFGMTPASRYQHNLKVLRRRDPSIVSIFDQFSHVCLYHHNGSKWEKQGYEGSMFLYEREAYPPYGFYILNRMGMDDHIQRLYPEDNIGAHGSYLIIRSFPEFTDRRLALAQSQAQAHTGRTGTAPGKFSDIYAIPSVEKLTAHEKGESKTIGLWMFATDAREPLIDVFSRLHSFIKKNHQYPQEFRYGPDRPPPSIPGSAGPVPVLAASTLANGRSSTSNEAPHPSHPQTNGEGGGSDIDNLFAFAGAKAEPQGLPMSTSTSKMTVESLFAALGGGDLMAAQSAEQDNHVSSSASLSSLPPLPVSASGTSTFSTSSTGTGISLLDSIFASAHGTPAPTTPGAQNQNAPTIYSPTASLPPQVLNQDVVSTLLGRPPSRTASAASRGSGRSERSGMSKASTAYSTGAQSHSSSREGDNEYDEFSDHVLHHRHPQHSDVEEDAYSESSTVLDPDAEYDEELQAAGASAGRPLLAEYGSVTGHNGHIDHFQQRQDGRGRTLGDVTPRAPMNGFGTPPFTGAVRALSQASSNGHNHSHTPTEANVRPPAQAQPPSTNIERMLVPFEPDSELWPYPRGSNASGEDGDEILELDFADTSALSDLETYRRTMQRRRENSKSDADMEDQTLRKARKGKKGKNERAREQARAREDIERSWDSPAIASPVAGARVYGNGSGNGSVGGQRSPSTASPSPCPSPDLYPETLRRPSGSASVMQPTNGVVSKATGGRVNRNGKEKQDPVEDGVITALAAQRLNLNAPPLGRNDFVREVLTLIHTDKAFVDRMYREYTNRLAA